MRCAHCCFACTGKGTFMGQEIFDKCLSTAKKFGWDITIGGGEPTLHPKIHEWAMQAALACLDVSLDQDGPAVLVVTNGKKTDAAIKLAQMAHLGIISAEVSQDPWHDEIDPKVVAEFTRYNNPETRYEYSAKRRDYAGVRDVSDGVKGVGRATRDENIDVHDGCACSALFVSPNGDFYGCGCKIKKIGNILTDTIPQEIFDIPGECQHYRDKELQPA